MSKNNTGQMRLQRESRMAKKDIDTQIKKHGKVTDNFICLPDPQNPYHWYYIVFGLDMPGFEGGFYLGRVECPDDYPAKAPKILMITENGRFHLNERDGICMSISSLHNESWNPAWKVNNMVVGLLSFWLGDAQGTYGELKESHFGRSDDQPKRMVDHRYEFAKKSREHVLNHPKFKEVFAGYESAIGIDKETNEDVLKIWSNYDKKYAEYLEVEWPKILAERKRQRELRELRHRMEHKINIYNDKQHRKWWDQERIRRMAEREARDIRVQKKEQIQNAREHLRQTGFLDYALKKAAEVAAPAPRPGRRYLDHNNRVVDDNRRR